MWNTRRGRLVVIAGVCLLSGVAFIGLPGDAPGPLRYFGAGVLVGLALLTLIVEQQTSQFGEGRAGMMVRYRGENFAFVPAPTKGKSVRAWAPLLVPAVIIGLPTLLCAVLFIQVVWANNRGSQTATNQPPQTTGQSTSQPPASK
jgi:hypothetical protein